ncbi:hypothetical protein C2E23DRAFT_105990 [Lenzites betulinus]|nr:hypothetical protein C2E23DRAFT_105990 [Lenzites betulinus]
MRMTVETSGGEGESLRMHERGMGGRSMDKTTTLLDGHLDATTNALAAIAEKVVRASTAGTLVMKTTGGMTEEMTVGMAHGAIGKGTTGGSRVGLHLDRVHGTTPLVSGPRVRSKGKGNKKNGSNNNHANNSNNGRQKRNWRDDDSQLNNWTRRDAPSSKKSAPPTTGKRRHRGSVSPGRSRSPSDSHYSRRSYRSRSRSLDTPKRRRRDDSPPRGGRSPGDPVSVVEGVAGVEVRLLFPVTAGAGPAAQHRVQETAQKQNIDYHLPLISRISRCPRADTAMGKTVIGRGVTRMVMGSFRRASRASECIGQIDATS